MSADLLAKVEPPLQSLLEQSSEYHTVLILFIDDTNAILQSSHLSPCPLRT